ncbi:MAG: hypothetical protein ABSD62_11420 [Candidatus Limnocylindrales bacterium]
MAKRTRGNRGQRHADRHSPARQQPRPASRPSQGLSAAEEARAAELESQIVAQERAAQQTMARSRDRSRPADVGSAGRFRGQSPLAVRAAEEYGYVSRDVRRILRVGGAMVAILSVFFVLIDVLHVIKV